MKKEKEVQLSKYLSFVLRHKPEEVGIMLDKQGWTDISNLMEKSKGKVNFSLEDLRFVVENNSKKRFEISEDGNKIRAQQGHSVEVELKLENIKPPKSLFHGTSKKFLSMIEKEGLRPMSRHDVHLTKNLDTAKNVGIRYGKTDDNVEILEIDSEKMYEDGFNFQVTGNDVYLTKSVPSKYIKNFR